MAGPADVMRCAELPAGLPRQLLAPFGLEALRLPDDAPIPGSYWGAPEAGLVGHRLMFRDDTPVHSLLHESCHYICMDDARRTALHTDAGGDFLEESAVCYLQVLLADAVPGLGRARLLADMDRWGYSFRLGSARAWFEEDAGDARQWLVSGGIIDSRERLLNHTPGHGHRLPHLGISDTDSIFSPLNIIDSIQSNECHNN